MRDTEVWHHESWDEVVVFSLLIFWKSCASPTCISWFAHAWHNTRTVIIVDTDTDTRVVLETLVMSVRNSGQLVFKVACPFNSHASSRRTRCLRDDNCYSTYVCTHLIYIHIHIRESCRVKWFTTLSALSLGGGNNNSSSENENIRALSALSVLL